MKSPESLIYDQPFYIIGFNWWSRNYEHFSVGLPQLEITDLPGTLWSLLWILGKKYVLVKGTKKYVLVKGTLFLYILMWNGA